jgi:hypothetical protein
MEWKLKPRNKNITIRITKEEKREFKEIANTNCVSESNWAYHILKKHKNSYGKTENIDQLLDGIETVIEGYKFIKESLETEIKKSHHNELLLQKHTDLVMRRNDVNINKYKIIKLKRQIIDSKLV